MKTFLVTIASPFSDNERSIIRATNKHEAEAKALRKSRRATGAKDYEVVRTQNITPTF